MKYVVIGQGAIGLLWYAHLKLISVETTLLCSKRLTSFDTTMTLVDLDQVTHNIDIVKTAPSALKQADVVIFCLKSYVLLDALIEYKPLLASNTQIILCHNGMLPINNITDIFPHHTIYTLLTSHGSKKHDEFSIEHTGTGKSQIGFITQPTNEPPTDIIQTLNSALPSVQWHDDIRHQQWLKLAVNCVINPLTAIHNIDNGQVLSNELHSKITNICQEIVQVATHEDIELNVDELVNTVKDVAQLTAKNCSSMRADILKKKTTEIEQINGFILTLARQYNEHVPHNTSMVEFIKALELKGDKPSHF